MFETPELTHAVQNDFVLAPKHRDRMEKYYLLHWEFPYFLSSLVHGTLTHQDTLYFVKLLNRFSGEDFFVSSREVVKLSFRKPANLPYGYVLVTRHSPSSFIDTSISANQI